MTPVHDAVDGDRERARWAASAAAWDRWADPMADLADKLNQPLLDAAGVAAGDRVLDLASGAGEPALSAARRVGPSGLVLATDLVPGMMTGAVRRAAEADHERPVFAAADMTRLPLPDGAIDRVTCRFGIMFVPDAGAALAEVRRVLRPDGSAAFMVWGPRAGNALFEVVAEAVADHLGEDHSIDPLFRFAETGRLAGAMRSAGFATATDAELTPVRKAPKGQPFWRATLDMVFGHRLDELDTAARGALETDIDRRFAERATGDLVPLPAHVRIVSGTTPA